MKKLITTISLVALLASSSFAVAGGLNEQIDDPVVKEGPSSSFPLWVIIPAIIILGCAVSCGNGGNGNNGNTAGNDG